MNRITQLIIRYLKEELTTEEQKELDHWIALSEENKRFVEQYTEQYIAEKLALMSEIDWRAGYNKFLARYLPEELPDMAPVKKLPVRWIAAAVLLLLLAVAWFLWINPSKKIPAKEDNALISGRYKNDIAPGGRKAILTLGNAQTIILDTASNTTLAGQGSNAINKEGELNYEGRSTPVITYNTVTTPRGGAYKVVLPDGSKVWLNAASSIRFPTFFSGKERKVEVTGEVYFEVAAHPSTALHPSTPLRTFKVLVNDVEVEVVGTHFNINAYDDEAAIYTTLLEGKVKVKTTAAGGKVRILQPGQQAQIKDQQLSVIEKVDEESVVAWKNGYFHFEGTDIQTIMRQVARWYDVTISYETPIYKEFVATINRDEPVSKLLQLLELTNEVHFRIDGKKIHVMP